MFRRINLFQFSQHAFLYSVFQKRMQYATRKVVNSATSVFADMAASYLKCSLGSTIRFQNYQTYFVIEY